MISGDIAPPGHGVIALDRGAYRVPDQIGIELIDTDLAGLPTASVLLTSTTEPAGESIDLAAAGSTGVFTGAVATATGAATTDGKLQMSHDDTIEARYFDASAGVTRIATARADLVPPVLSNVSATNQFAQEIISWTSDEPATSIVRYGTNSVPGAFTSAITNDS